MPALGAAPTGASLRLLLADDVELSLLGGHLTSAMSAAGFAVQNRAGTLEFLDPSRRMEATCLTAVIAEKEDAERFLQETRRANAEVSRHIALVLAKFGSVSPSLATLLNTYHGVWVTTEYQRQACSLAGVREELLRTIPVGVDAARFRAQARSADQPIARFGAIANWDESDGIDLLLRGYVRAFEGAKDVRLALLLNGRACEDALPEIQALLTQVGVPDERIPDIDLIQYSDAEAAELYKSCDCFVAPMRSDALGIWPLEAAAAGLAVVITAHRSFREVFPPHTVCFIPVAGQIPASGTRLAERYRLTEQSMLLQPTVEGLADVLRRVREYRDQTANLSHFAAAHAATVRPASHTVDWLLRYLGAVQPKAERRGSAAARELPRQPRIGFDMRSMAYPEIYERGIGAYAKNHLAALAELLPEVRFTMYFDTDKAPESTKGLLSRPNIDARWIDESDDPPPGLYHIPDPMSMLPHYDSPFSLAPRGVPLSALFHDMIPLVLRQMHFDYWTPPTRRSYFGRLDQVQRRNALVLTNSEHTRHDVHKYSGVPLQRIVAVMAGINRETAGSPVALPAIKAVLAKYGLQEPYFISVGALDDHKDPRSMFEGFYLAQSRLPGLRFAVIGSPIDPNKEMWRRQLEQSGVKGVVFTGFTSGEDLRCLYAAAAGLVFPSTYEGFGFPVLEAMANSCPVITTHASSLPEVAGEAALLVPVADPHAIAAAMLDLAGSAAFREARVAAGRQQAARFSWAETARRTCRAWLSHFDLPWLEQITNGRL